MCSVIIQTKKLNVVFSHENLQSFLFLLTPNREPLRRRRSIAARGRAPLGSTSASAACHRGASLEPPREGAAFFFGRCRSFCSLGETSLTGDPRSVCRDVESRSRLSGCKPEARWSPHPCSQLAGAPPLYCHYYHVYLHIAILQRKT